MRSSKAVWIFCTPRVIKLFLVLKKVFKSLKEIFCRLELTAKTMLHKSVASVKFYSFRDHLFFLRILWSCSTFWKHFICWNVWNKNIFAKISLLYFFDFASLNSLTSYPTIHWLEKLRVYYLPDQAYFTWVLSIKVSHKIAKYKLRLWLRLRAQLGEGPLHSYLTWFLVSSVPCGLLDWGPQFLTPWGFPQSLVPLASV